MISVPGKSFGGRKTANKENLRRFLGTGSCHERKWGEANKAVPVNPADQRKETAPSVHPEGRQPWQQELQA